MTQQQLGNNSLASKALASTALGLMSSSVGIPIGENVNTSAHSSCEQSPAPPHPTLHSSGSGSGLSGIFSFKNALSAMTSGKSDKHKAPAPVVPHTPPPQQSAPPHFIDNSQLQSISLINQQQQQIALKNAQGIYK
jgi:hypothetical protein